MIHLFFFFFKYLTVSFEIGWSSVSRESGTNMNKYTIKNREWKNLNKN